MLLGSVVLEFVLLGTYLTCLRVKRDLDLGLSSKHTLNLRLNITRMAMTTSTVRAINEKANPILSRVKLLSNSLLNLSKENCNTSSEH
jgi:hypothetical protein